MSNRKNGRDESWLWYSLGLTLTVLLALVLTSVAAHSTTPIQGSCGWMRDPMTGSFTFIPCGRSPIRGIRTPEPFPIHLTQRQPGGLPFLPPWCMSAFTSGGPFPWWMNQHPFSPYGPFGFSSQGTMAPFQSMPGMNPHAGTHAGF